MSQRSCWSSLDSGLPWSRLVDDATALVVLPWLGRLTSLVELVVRVVDLFPRNWPPRIATEAAPTTKTTTIVTAAVEIPRFPGVRCIVGASNLIGLTGKCVP